MNTKLESLSPVVSEYSKIYVDVLKETLMTDNMNNIALTGGYGSGKSSVITTLMDDKVFASNLNIIEVSMMSFDDQLKKDDDHKDGKLFHTPSGLEIEAHIINQIMYQIDPDLIPMSSFKSRKNVTGKYKIILTIVIIYVCTYTYSLFYQVTIINILPKYASKFYSSNFGQLSFLSLFIIAFGYLIYLVVSLIKDNEIISKIKASGLELQFEKDKSSSLFNKYVRDIIYVIISSKTDVIIFEDIDRFNDPSLFTKLINLNLLLNRNLEKTRKKSLDKSIINYSVRFAEFIKLDIFKNTKGNNQSKKIKFLYLVKDDIFNSDERTKLFDVLIPIIPVMNLDNSFEHLVTYQKEVPRMMEIDETVLYGLSTYIGDLRLLKNIINEYKIYFLNLENTKISYTAEELFAMICYKNICSKDYARIYTKKSYFDLIFTEMEQKRTKYIADNETKLPIDTLHTIEHASLNEAISLMQVDLNMSESKIEYDKIDEQNNDKIDYKFMNFLITTSLIKFENYRDYVSVFYGNSITLEDRDFIRDILNQSEPELHRNIDSPSTLISRIPITYFSQKGTLNYLLARKIFESDTHASIQERFMKNSHLKYEDFLIKYLRDGINTERMTRIVLSSIPDVLLSEFNQQNLDIIKHILGFKEVLNWFPVTTIEESSINDENIRQLINEHYKINDIEIKILSDHKYNKTGIHDDLVETDRIFDDGIFYENLAKMRIEFTNISLPKGNQYMKEIYSKSLYECNLDNVFVVMEYLVIIKEIRELDKSKILSIINENVSTPLHTHVTSNFKKFLESYIESEISDFNDAETDVLLILNDLGTMLELKKSYINRLKTIISDSSKVQDQTLFPLLLTNQLIKNTRRNILHIISTNAFALSSDLLRYLNNNSHRMEYSQTDYEEYSEPEKKKLVDAILIVENLSDAAFGNLISSTMYVYQEFNLPGLKKEKFELLIKSNIISITKVNLKYIQENYIDYLKKFIEGNFKTYYEFRVKERNIPSPEFTVVMESKVFTIDEKKEFIDIYTAIVKVDPAYEDEINLYLLDKNTPLSYITDSILIYQDLSNVIKTKIISKIVSNFDVLLLSGYLTKQVTVDLMVENIEVIQKIKLLAIHASEMIDIDLVRSVKYSKIDRFGNLGTNKQIRANSSPEVDVIMDELVKRGLINSKSTRHNFSYGYKSDKSLSKVKKILENMK